MAYNNYYNPYTNYGNYPVQQNTQPTIQHGGFVNVQSEQEARDYPIANGTSITFIDSPHMKLYVKTRGFSSLDQPTFKDYDIVERTVKAEQTEPVNNIEYAEKGEFNALRAEFEALKKELNGDE